MAYADFYPELLNEHQCIKYAAAVANDKDGYRNSVLQMGGRRCRKEGKYRLG